jgi:hypothetical protein
MRPVIDAWWATGAFGAADLIFGVDVDDAQYPAYVEIARSNPQVKVGLLPEWQPLVPKLNFMAQLAAKNEAYTAIAFMGDDHVPITPMWAHMLVQHHMRRPNSIWYGPDGFQDQKLPTWWSMDSRIVRALGGRMVPAPVQHMYCDNSVMELGKKTGSLNYDERILIEHRHPFAGKGKMDAQYERVNRTQQYERDGLAFQRWMADGLEADAKLLSSVGG